VKKIFENDIVSLVKIQIYSNSIFRKYLGARVIWTFKETFNGNLTMMALNYKKLYPDDI
jgi:hypothetical protein